MTELIQQLLLSHNCVVIPGFGAFIGNYNPAEISLIDHKILPPNKTIAFNRSLQNNDGLMMNAAVEKFGISYKEADEKVMAFSKECKESLANIKSLILKDIGRFTLDDEQKIQFQPFSNRNYLLDSYGLETLSINPIHRLKDAEAAIKENYQRIMHPELITDVVLSERRTSKVPYWIMAVLGIAFLTTTATWNIHKSNENRSYSSLLPVIESPASEAEPVQTQLAAKQPSIVILQPVAASTPKSMPVVVIPKINKTGTGKSYIVVGAFFDEIHAGKVMAEAEAKGYTAQMTTDYNNTLFRVSVEVETTDMSATLQKIKSGFNQRAWVFCTNCAIK